MLSTSLVVSTALSAAVGLSGSPPFGSPWFRSFTQDVNLTVSHQVGRSTAQPFLVVVSLSFVTRVAPLSCPHSCLAGCSANAHEIQLGLSAITLDSSPSPFQSSAKRCSSANRPKAVYQAEQKRIPMLDVFQVCRGDMYLGTSGRRFGA
jgi:hypothetical protein